MLHKMLNFTKKNDFTAYFTANLRGKSKKED